MQYLKKKIQCFPPFNHSINRNILNKEYRPSPSTKCLFCKRSPFYIPVHKRKKQIRKRNFCRGLGFRSQERNSIWTEGKYTILPSTKDFLCTQYYFYTIIDQMDRTFVLFVKTRVFFSPSTFENNFRGWIIVKIFRKFGMKMWWKPSNRCNSKCKPTFPIYYDPVTQRFLTRQSSEGNQLIWPTLDLCHGSDEHAWTDESKTKNWLDP